MQCSIHVYKARQRKEKEIILQTEFTDAKQMYESDPSEKTANRKSRNFYEEKLQGIIQCILLVHRLVGVNMVKELQMFS